MLADRSDLEPVLDHDNESEPPRDEARPEGPSVLVVLALALTLVAGVLAAALGQYVRHQENASARALAEAESAQAAAERSESRLRAVVIAEAERERARARAEEGELYDATANRFVLREPIVVVPPTVRICRPTDVEVFEHPGPGAGVALTNRSGRPCGLPDYPVLEGLDEGGRWRTVPVLQSPASSYTDGPAWTGVLVPGLVAVLAIEQPEPLRSGVCLSGAAEPEDFSGLRFVFGSQSEPLVVPDRTWSVGPCQPEMLLWAYDHVGG